MQLYAPLKGKKIFVEFCKNVRYIDYHASFISKIKNNFELKIVQEFNLVWEGLPEKTCFNRFANDVINF